MDFSAHSARGWVALILGMVVAVLSACASGSITESANGLVSTLATPTPEIVPTVAPAPDQVEPLVTDYAMAAGLDGAMSPAADCEPVIRDTTRMPTWFACSPGPVVATAAGQVILASDSPGSIAGAPMMTASPWSWARGQSLGDFVVVNHGTTHAAHSAISVYWNLASLGPDITNGVVLTAGQELGTVETNLGWEIWVDDRLPGVADPPIAPLEISALAEADALAFEAITPAPACSYPEGDPIGLPNSPREYRSGVHQGIDFFCGAPGQRAVAFRDGTVAMVSGRNEPTSAERELMLASAAAAGATPHWILTALYGNFVVLDHGVIDGAGQVFTIYAHLNVIAPELTPGAAVSRGQDLGEIGASGTSTAARDVEEIDPTAIHLHWEIIIDQHYLGEGLSQQATERVYRRLLCINDSTLDCPPDPTPEPGTDDTTDTDESSDIDDTDNITQTDESSDADESGDDGAVDENENDQSAE